MKNKHLIIFSYDYPPNDGGVARLCKEIAAGAKDYYQNVKVLTVDKTGISKPYNAAENIKIVRIGGKRGKLELNFFRYLRSIKNKHDYDILCGLWHPEAIIALLSGFKNVYTLAHGTELLYGQSKFKKYFWLPIYSHFILGKVKRVIGNSHYTQQLALKVNRKANAVALPLAVNHNFFRPLKKQKSEDGILSICSVSRIHKFKGYDFIIKTIADLPKEYKSKIRYNVAGKGAYLSELKQFVKDLNLENIVSFKGFVADEDLPAFYNGNDLFILCTRESKDSTAVEGFGLVFLEAQSCGIPAIGTRTGGIPDAIEEENGGWLIGTG